MASWYHVCAGCNAKWFQPDQSTECPRCGRPSQSSEQIAPPWPTRAESASTDRSADHRNTPAPPNADPANPAADKLDKVTADWQRAYREQLRRMSCPGCGEGEPNF